MFRRALAREIGMDLDKMEGWVEGGGGLPWDNVVDPIKDLLDHSDCDGHLTPKQCRVIAPRLRKLTAHWQPGPDKSKSGSMATGMDQAAKKKQNFKFQCNAPLEGHH
jgi:hypothetical protein